MNTKNGRVAIFVMKSFVVFSIIIGLMAGCAYVFKF